MAKKKLLSEAQVRRFMGLAGMQANTVSNRMNEMYGSAMSEEDPSPADAEMAPMDGMGEPEDMDEPEDMGGMEGDVELDPAKINAAMDGIEAAMAVLEPLAAAAGAGADEMDAEMDEPEGDDMDEPMGDDKDDDMGETMYESELGEVDLELSEDDIVQEVAKRVAKRIIKAKRAQKRLNEALGRK